MTAQPLTAVLRVPVAVGSTLALDLGTTTGWALRSPDRRITSGVAKFQTGRFEGGGMRYLRFARWLDEINSLAGPLAMICFEEVRSHVGTDAAHVYGGLMATLTAWAEARVIPYQGVPVGTWKKCVCGKGNASKADVITAMKLQGFNPSGPDEADALAVLHWALFEGGLS